MGGGEQTVAAWLGALRALPAEDRAAALDATHAPAIWRAWAAEQLGLDPATWLGPGAALGPDPQDPRTGRPWSWRSRDGRDLVALRAGPVDRG